jgi:hypothetical protein
MGGTSRAHRPTLIDFSSLQIATDFVKRCIFCVPFKNILGHIVCREVVLVDPTKVVVILNMTPPTSAK